MRQALLLALLALAGCGKEKVWLVAKNETGRRLSNVKFDAQRYGIVEAGYTFADWAQPGGRPLSLSYEDQGVTKRPGLKPMTDDMSGGVLTVRIAADGTVSQSYEAGPGPRGSGLLGHRLIVIAGAACAAVLAFFLLAWLRRGASAAGAALKKAMTNQTLEELKRRVPLSEKPCPIPMMSGGDSPRLWWEGRSGGRMVGFTSGRLWVGEVDEETLAAYERREGGGFAVHDYTERDDSPLLSPAMLALITRLTPAAARVHLLAAAVYVEVDWSKASVDGILADIGVLKSALTAVEATHPPLVKAILDGDETKVLELLAGKPDLEATTIGYVNALRAAVDKGRTGLVEALLKAGAKPQPEYGFPLHRAAALGHAAIVKALLDAGVSADLKDPTGATPLIEASAEGKADVVSFLLSRGADPNLADGDGRTALSNAKYCKFNKIIELLIAGGAKDD